MPRPAVLFVPGAMLGSWVWEDNFSCFFRQQGYDTHALDFSGTGQPFFKRSRLLFSDYVAECARYIEYFDTPPIVIAHSMGGLIALHAACRAQTKTLILLSPAPVQGVLTSLMLLLKRSPASFFKFALALLDARIACLGEPPIGFFSTTCNQRTIKETMQRLQSEPIAVMLALLRPHSLWKTSLKTQRVLFIGAEGDLIIPPTEVIKSANLLGSAYKIYPNFCHFYQAEKEWHSIAEDMMFWLNTGFDQRLSE